MFSRFHLAGAATLSCGLALGFLSQGQGQTNDRPVPVNYFARAWQADDGLPGNAVNEAVQDRQGFIWLASLEGLVRFDGMNFKVVSAPLITKPSVRNIRALVREDESTLLMLPAVGGVIRLKDGQFSVHPMTSGLAGRQLQKLFVEPGGAIWVGMAGGLVRRWENGKTVEFGPADGLSTREKCVFAADNQGQVWIASREFLLCYREGRLIRFDETNSPFGFVNVAESRSGGVWIWKGAKLFKMETNQLCIISTNLPWTPLDAVVRIMFEDSNGVLWIGTREHGLFQFANGEFARVDTSQNQITSITEDREGSLWVSTVGGGINRLRPNFFQLYNTRSGLPEDVSDSVCTDAWGDIWLANRRSGVVRIHQGQITAMHHQLGHPLGAFAICTDDRGGVWASDGTVFYTFHRDAPQQIELPRTNLNNIHTLFKSHDGDIWIAAEPDVLGRFRQGRINDYVPENNFPGGSVRAIAEDSAGRMWIGTEAGKLYELADGKFTAFTAQDGLPDAPIRALYADASGSIWIGTIGGGLGLRRNDRFTRITAAKGLPDDTVAEILEDDNGRIWCGSRRGIFHVPKSNLLAYADGLVSQVNGVILGKSDGLPAISCLGTCQPMAWKARDGRLWFATQQGALMVAPADLKANTLPSPVIIDEVLVNDQTLLMTEGMRVPPVCKKIEFKFAALSYAAPEKVRIRYRLEGVDSDWNEMVNHRAAIYAGLPPGEYKLRATACNADGIWNETGALLAFTVLPAWWQSWWFKSAVSALFVTALALSVNYWSQRRLKLKLERLEYQQALGRERTRIARDLHDDLGASLTQVGLMLEELRENSIPQDEMKRQSAALSGRVRTLARDLDAVVWTVNPKNDLLTELVAYLSQFFLECFRRTAIRPRLQVMENISEHSLSPEARHHLFLAVKEAINNVIKHSHATEVTLTLREADGIFEVRLQDDGVGFSMESAARSNRQGLTNMRTRIRELSGELELQSEPGKGALICLRIPVASAAGVEQTQHD